MNNRAAVSTMRAALLDSQQQRPAIDIDQLFIETVLDLARTVEAETRTLARLTRAIQSGEQATNLQQLLRLKQSLAEKFYQRRRHAA